MHFLDTVFSLQFPMYQPGILEGGRGWLHSLMFQTKPLYHAALAFSAYHRRITMLSRLSPSSQVAALVQQAKHFDICIKQVSGYSQNSCAMNGLGIAIAVIQVAFFEVVFSSKDLDYVLTFAVELFSGSGNTWQPHVRAAVFMYQRGHEKSLEHFGLLEKSRTLLYEDLAISEHEALVAEQILAFRFLSGTVIWLDIISAITAGTAPFLITHHSSVLAPNSQTKLEDYMGCRNWVMLQIGRIAALHEQKTQTLKQGLLECKEFEQAVGDITGDNQCGLIQEVLEDLKISDSEATAAFSVASNTAVMCPTSLVTHTFACMASIYLHLVTYDFQKLEILEATILVAMGMLQTPIVAQLLPALVAPLFIIGCVAREEDQQFFRHVFSSSPLLNPSLKHREKMLPILEEIWNRRQTTPGFSWNDILELTSDVLLV